MSKPNTAAGTNTGNPVVTVVIPCHNHADMLGNAIDSVTMQEYRPIQIIVVDDGSNDNPEKIVEEKMNQDVSISLIRSEEAKGPSAARNAGVQNCWDNSDLFIMLDADDLYLQGKISKSVEKYLEYPQQIGIVYTDAVIKNINTKTKIHEYRRPFSRKELELECIVSNTPLVSKKAFLEVGGYDEDMRTAEDWDLWLRITEKFVAVHIPETLHVYHVTGKNSSDVVPQEIWLQNWQKIRARIQERQNGASK